MYIIYMHIERDYSNQRKMDYSMFEVSQELVEQPAKFVQESVTRLVPAARVRVDYMNLIPESACVYFTERDAVTIDD